MPADKARLVLLAERAVRHAAALREHVYAMPEGGEAAPVVTLAEMLGGDADALLRALGVEAGELTAEGRAIIRAAGILGDACDRAETTTREVTDP